MPKPETKGSYFDLDADSRIQIETIRAHLAELQHAAGPEAISAVAAVRYALAVTAGRIRDNVNKGNQ